MSATPRARLCLPRVQRAVVVTIFLTAGACAGVETTRGAPPAFPEACRSKPSEGGEAPWHWKNHGCQAVRAVDGGLVVMHDDHLHRVDGRGRDLWEVPIRGRDDRSCGAETGLAIADDGRVAVSCGYSLLAYDADGKRRWQVWPNGNHSTSAPVAGDGRWYVVAGGVLVALDADGETVWRGGPGGRSTSEIGATPDGHFLLDSTEDVWFGSDGTIYHPDPDPTFHVIDRDGRPIRSEPHGGRPTWPAWVPVVDEAGGRMPPRRPERAP